MDGELCRFYRLPQEIQDYIFNIIQINACKLIKKILQKNKINKITARKMIQDLTIYDTRNGNYRYHPFHLNVVEAFAFCSKVLTGKESYHWWMRKLFMLKNGLNDWQEYITPTKQYHLYRQLQYVYTLWMKLDGKFKKHYYAVNK